MLTDVEPNQYHFYIPGDEGELTCEASSGTATFSSKYVAMGSSASWGVLELYSVWIAPFCSVGPSAITQTYTQSSYTDDHL